MHIIYLLRIAVVKSLLLVGACQSQPYNDAYCPQKGHFEMADANRLYIFGGSQTANLPAFMGGIGINVFRDYHIKLTYHRGSGIYDADFLMSLCGDCIRLFEGLWLGFGREFRMPLSKNYGLFANAFAAYGLEAVRYGGVTNRSEAPFFFNPSVKPQLSLGVYLNRFDVFAGVNYFMWLPQAMTEKRYPINHALNGNRLIWDVDLHPGRSGFAFIYGVRVFLF